MSERSQHRFQFQANEIAEAARKEAEYHENRRDHWEGRASRAEQIVRDTVQAEVVERDVTGGKQIGVVVKYGDAGAWDELQLAYSKMQSHADQADRYRTDERLYSTQGVTVYDLDTDDVHHFRLGGQERPD